MNQGKIAESCVLCGRKDIHTSPASFCSFLIERMFEGRETNTKLVYCPKCSFYFSSYRPSDYEMSLLYKDYRGDDYQQQRQRHEENYTKEFNTSLGFSPEGQERRHQLIMQTVSPFINAEAVKHILDYGGDAGQYIPDTFVNSDKTVFDISGIETVNGVSLITQKENLINEHYDLILCCHVLEHVSYPMEILNHIKSLMPEKGYLYLELPSEHAYHDSCIKEGVFSYVHEHINSFSLKTLEAVFSHHDFIILSNDYNGTAISCLVQKNSDTAYTAPFKVSRKYWNALESENIALHSKIEGLQKTLNEKDSVLYQKIEVLQHALDSLAHESFLWRHRTFKTYLNYQRIRLYSHIFWGQKGRHYKMKKEFLRKKFNL